MSIIILTGLLTTLSFLNTSLAQDNPYDIQSVDCKLKTVISPTLFLGAPQKRIVLKVTLKNGSSVSLPFEVNDRYRRDKHPVKMKLSCEVQKWHLEKVLNTESRRVCTCRSRHATFSKFDSLEQCLFFQPGKKPVVEKTKFRGDYECKNSVETKTHPFSQESNEEEALKAIGLRWIEPISVRDKDNTEVYWIDFFTREKIIPPFKKDERRGPQLIPRNNEPDKQDSPNASPKQNPLPRPRGAQ